jgi:intracellular sulfur oxidation DsrE/DsrF family protein
LLTLVLLGAGPLSAQEEDPIDRRYFTMLELHTADELHQVLSRAEKIFLDEAMPAEPEAGLTVLMHGPEVRVLLRENYRANRAVVDLAARLSALGVVDLKACRTWMGGHGVDAQALQPFVSTVPDAVAEAERLRRESSYLAF